MLQHKKFLDIPVSNREEARESHPHPEEPRFRFIVPEEGFISCVVEKEFPAIPSHLKWRRSPQKGERNSWVVPLFPESPRCSVHNRETSFPSTASTFKPRIDSHHGGTWDNHVAKPRVKASRESHRSLDPREGKRDTAATVRKEISRACPHSRRGLTPLGRLQKYPKIHVST